MADEARGLSVEPQDGGEGELTTTTAAPPEPSTEPSAPQNEEPTAPVVSDPPAEDPPATRRNFRWPLQSSAAPKDPDIWKVGSSGGGEGEGEDEESSNKNRILIKIILLDGQDLLLNCPRKVKAESVIEYVHKDYDTEEKDFFSLFFFVDGEKNDKKIFLDPEKTIVHQLPADHRQVQPWVLYYGVKFYLPDPSKFKADQSRYLFTLQLCNDIKSNRVLIDYETAKRLTALMMQATLGDYDEEQHKPGYTAEFEEFHLIPKDHREENYEEDVMEYHKSKAGYSPARAETEFCDVARRLVRYGFHLFGVHDDQSDVFLVANGFPGIKIYRSTEEVHQFKWPNIVKISYKRRKFRIKYHPLDSEGEPEEDKIEQLKYYCGKQPAAKRVWKNAVEQHTFFRLHSPDPPNKISFLFRRGSKFRYSGRTLRQTIDDKTTRKHHDIKRSYSERLTRSTYKNYAPHYVPARNSFRPRTREDHQEEQDDPSSLHIEIQRKGPKTEEWVQLDAPPTQKDVDTSKLEQQRVEVNFSVWDGLPEDKYKAVLRKSGGSMEVISTEEGAGEPCYKLSPIDQESQAIMTSVSLRVDPEAEGEEPGSHGNKTVVFDSSNLPSVSLNMDTSTSTTVMETSGKTVTTGGVTHSYQYTSTTVETTTAVAPAPGEDGSDEAIQVELFVNSEGKLLQDVLNASAKVED